MIQEYWDNLDKAAKEKIAEKTMGMCEDSLKKDVYSKDPWIHRKAGMLCQSCMWFVEKASCIPHKESIGRCRRHAPTMSGYPAVFKTDWCGDHKLDENKL